MAEHCSHLRCGLSPLVNCLFFIVTFSRQAVERMRILILSDLHSNWIALQAVLEQVQQFDACLVLGDLVEYGPQPREVIDWVQQHATVCIRGNHDHAVAEFLRPRREDTPWHLLRNHLRFYHWQTMTTSEIRYLRSLPLRERWAADELIFHLVHASPLDPLHEYLIDNLSIWNERAAGLEGDFLCVGHTHRQLNMPLANLTLINPGSVGQQKEGGGVANYVLIENGQPQLLSASYSLDALMDAYLATGLDSQVCYLARLVYQQGFRMVEPIK